MATKSKLARSNFCALPWIHMYGSVDGVWGRCCVDESTYGTGSTAPRSLPANAIGCAEHSPHASLNPGRVLDLLSAFNSSPMRDTRRAMLAGRVVEACDYCYRREQAGARSYRQIANDLYLDDVLQGVVQATREDGHVDAFPTYIDIRLGNLCNLACVMCEYPISSTVGLRQGLLPTIARIEPFPINDSLWPILEANAQVVRRVYFAGGEPLLQPMHFRLLDLLIAHGCPSLTTIAYSTNLTLIPDGWLERLRHFASVDIGASCDGVGAVFERIRIGARWEVFSRNVVRIRDEFPVRLAVTTQRDNVNHLDDLIAWAVQEHCDVDLSNILVLPSELSILALPEEDRNALGARYSALSTHYRNTGHPSVADQLQMVVTVLTEGATTSNPMAESTL